MPRAPAERWQEMIRGRMLGCGAEMPEETAAGANFLHAPSAAGGTVFRFEWALVIDPPFHPERGRDVRIAVPA